VCPHRRAEGKGPGMLPFATIPDTTPMAVGASPVMGAGAPRLRPRLSASFVSDPAEPWEIPVLRRDRYKIDRMLPGRPFRPAKWSDIPDAALTGLRAACGDLALERYYVVPKTTRLVNRIDCVITPAKVLAFGESRVGLWVDDGPAGRVSTIPIEGLLAVDDRVILLYGRLRLIALDAQIVVRYNTVSRTEVQENLRRLRSQMTTASAQVEPAFVWLDGRDDARPRARLPHKWRVVLENPAVRPDLDAPVRIAAGDLAEVTTTRTRPASGVAVLSGRELVIANEPVEYLDRARYGVDLLAVPRERLDCLHWNGESLTVRVVTGSSDAEAAAVTLPIDPYLVEAMWRAFGDEVRWT
jgi:hypothetical protein